MMTEKQPVREISEQYVTDLVYFNFIRLAQRYGSDPSKRPDSIDPQRSPLLDPNTRTLQVVIPESGIKDDDLKETKHPELISGIDYGQNAIEIFYRIGEHAAKVTLKLNEKTESVKMYTNNVYKVVHSQTDANFHTLDYMDKTKFKTGIHAIAGLLEKAEKVLERESKETWVNKFEGKKLTVKQKIYKSAGNFLKQSKTT